MSIKSNLTDNIDIVRLNTFIQVRIDEFYTSQLCVRESVFHMILVISSNDKNKFIHLQ
jgi:hypothetical protein